MIFDLTNQSYTLGDAEGHIYLIDQNFDVLIKSRIHKGPLTSIDFIQAKG